MTLPLDLRRIPEADSQFLQLLARIHPEQMQKIEELCQSHEHMVHGEMQLLVILGQLLVFAA